MMCPIGSKMCPFMLGDSADMMLCLGVKVFLLAWVIFVPVVITSRLEKIIKLLEKK